MVLEAVEALRRRSLVERAGAARFTLQSAVLEYVTGRLVEEMAEEMAAGVGAPIDQVQRECVDVARRLYERGFVKAAEEASAAGT